MTTLTSPKRIVFNRADHDYSAYYDEQLIGIFPTFHACEVALDDHTLDLAEQGLIDAPLAAMAESSLRAACEAPNQSADPWDDGPSQEEQADAAARWTPCDGGWEQYTPHPFDESKTVRLFMPRLFTADDTDEQGPAGPTPNDDVPNPMDYDKRCPTGADPSPGWLDEANRLAALYLLSRGIDACTVCGGAHRPTQCPDVAAILHQNESDIPNAGRAIYRQWHKDPQRFLNALRQLDAVCWWPLAEAYATHRGSAVQQALDVWLLAVQGTQQIPADYKQDLVLAQEA